MNTRLKPRRHGREPLPLLEWAERRYRWRPSAAGRFVSRRFGVPAHLAEMIAREAGLGGEP
jgi:hypothetical protein